MKRPPQSVEEYERQNGGPVYKTDPNRCCLERKLSLADAPRLKAAQGQRDLASARIVGLKRELATLAGEVAKYAGAIRTAERQIEAAGAPDGDADGGSGSVGPGRLLATFESALAAFRLQPDRERLAALEKRCAALLGAVSAAPGAKDAARGIDCKNSVKVMRSEPSPLPVLETMKRSMLKMTSAHSKPASVEAAAVPACTVASSAVWVLGLKTV